MARDTLTLAIGGNVPLDSFAKGIDQLRRLVSALSREIGVAHDVHWYIEDLQRSSAVATIHGEAVDMDSVERVVHAYASVGASLERRDPISYSQQVVGPAMQLSKLIDGPIEYVRFETPEDDFTLYP